MISVTSGRLGGQEGQSETPCSELGMPHGWDHRASGAWARAGGLGDAGLRGTRLFCKTAALFCMPTSHIARFPFPRILANTD